jgi:pimeloyl-ACP methyl ester carboxylesterase
MRHVVLFASLLARCALLAFFTAATLASAATPTLAPSTFESGLPVDTGALGTRIPVVLVHGLGGDAHGWDSLLQAYAQNPTWRGAFKPYSFSYSSTAADVLGDPTAPRTISALGAALRDAMQTYYDRPTAAPDGGFGNKRVVLLAHSMGGLVARSMMQEYVFRDGQRGGDKVLHLITLGTAHHGTPLADAAIVLGLQSELTDGYFGLLAGMAWTNFDGLDWSAGLCNRWLAQLDNYAPSAGADYGRCGSVSANPLPGYYEKIIAYGAATLQAPDLQLGFGVFKPGSPSWMLVPYALLHDGLSRSYRNDGMVPMSSSQFDGTAIWQKSEAFDCDHRYLEHGYPEFVRSLTRSYTDWAFCAGTDTGASFASGVSGGYAVSGSIYGVPGGIIDTIKTVSNAERVFDWAEQAFAAYLQPAGGTTQIFNGYYFRHYPSTQSDVGIKDGNVYYRGPASNQQIMFVATLANLLAQAQAAGF